MNIQHTLMKLRRNTKKMQPSRQTHKIRLVTPHGIEDSIRKRGTRSNFDNSHG